MRQAFLKRVYTEVKREAGDDAEVLKMMRREPHTKANEHFLRRFSHISQPALSKPLMGTQ